ncbi:uncharacterized protein LOC133905197 isoform X2 [Phragmites australis]|uniref:uncharacterized protein LOC133905197 isoform X2 n=1 Tax=Phragmites australis TaxID=29695 RepID=UPI002D780676|nr:uncharacterized protein LOC133905197 isoform X2 [Phragmites australis]
MQAATGSVSWVAAQPSVLGRCGGGAPSAPARGTGCGGAGGGGRVRAVGVARCCARAQEKRPPRVRKTKEERRELVESFINNYRVSNGGKFPSVNLTHKEVGGSYYIVREIVRDIIQENRVLGPGGLNATALSFEDCPDSSELSMKHELDQDNIEILDTSNDNKTGKDSASETSNSGELISLQKNAISTQTLLGSSNISEAGVLSGAARNGNAAGTACLQTGLEKQYEVSCETSREIDLNSSEEQAPSFAHVSDSDKDIVLDSLGDAHEGTAGSVTDGVILFPEPSAACETNGALLREHEASPNDSHDATTDSAVSEENLLAETNGVLQTSVPSDDAQIIYGQFSSTLSANPMDGFNLSTNSPETEDTTKTVELSKVHRLQDEFEQSSLDASPDEQENSERLVSHPAFDTEGLLQMEDKHSVLQVDESEFKKSMFGITKEVETNDASHDQETSTTTAISRHALCLLTLRCMPTAYNFLHTSQKATVY